MDRIIRRLTASRSLTLSAAVLYGVVEFVALRRSQVLANQDASKN